MRTFYEEWEILDSMKLNPGNDDDNANLTLESAKLEDMQINTFWHLQVPNIKDFLLEAFFTYRFYTS